MPIVIVNKNSKLCSKIPAKSKDEIVEDDSASENEDDSKSIDENSDEEDEDLKNKSSTSKKVTTSLNNAKEVEEKLVVMTRGKYSEVKDVVPKKVLSVKKTDLDDRMIKDKRTANMYKKLSQHQQIYKRPETYIGSIEPERRVEEIFNLETEKFEAHEIESAFAITHLFNEIATNAADNADDTRRVDENQLPADLVKKLKDVGKLELTIDKKRVKIRNSGMPMLVIPSDDLDGNLIPYCMFGVLNSGSNYNDEEYIRTGSGRNGLGSKACNIFSIFFRARIGDPINGQEFDAIWTGNMTELSYMKCTPGYEVEDGKFKKDNEGNYIACKGKKYTGKPYVEIEYELDFERFNIKEYSEEIFGVFAQRILFLGMGTKLIVSINGKDYDVRNIRDFAKLRFGEDICKSAIVHYEWPTTGRGKNKKSVIPERFEKMTQAQMEKAIMNPQSPDEIPTTEFIALDTPDDAVTLSSVNGQCTPEDGVHVTESLRAISVGVLEQINNTINDIKNKKSKKKKGKDEKEIKLPQLNIEAVKKHISLIVSCRLNDTTYSTQTKVKLMKPKPSITVEKKNLDKVKGWKLVEKLYEEMERKLDIALKKTDGKKKRFITPDKGEDANFAGGPKSLDCILYWTEGDSANSYPKELISVSPGGKDYGGYMPGKGKSLNICKASPQQIINNVEINRLKEYTGLFEGIDVTNPSDKSKMRYGFICISNDADKDGQHILMLRINYIWRRFPSLIEEGMIGYLETPFARALKGRKKNEKCLAVFRNQQQLNVWLEENEWFTPDKGSYWIKYYKGLASSRPHDIKADAKDAPMVVVIYDDKTERSLDIAFHPDNADLRKEWIAKWRNKTGLRDIEMEPISGIENKFTRSITSLCNFNLVDYSTETYLRALPSEDDGFKEAQRKAFYGALEKWEYGRGRSRSIKTGQIANATSTLTHYHYNEKCLIDTYTRQAQEFTGACNMGYYSPEGMLGSRHEGGSDAGESRYTEIDIADWVRYVYFKEFLEVVKFRVNEGVNVEPEWIPGVIPMHLVNGFKGIATAYSTFAPNHNPYDLIKWLLDRCQGVGVPQPIKPWYIDFNGKIELSNIDWSMRDMTEIQKVETPKSNKIKIVISNENKNSKPEEDEGSDEGSDIDDSESESSDESLDEDKKGFTKIKIINKKEDKAIRKANKPKKGGACMRTYGIFEQKGDTIIVTELPIGIWTYNYRKYWEKLRSEKIIKDIRDNSGPNTVKMTITGFQGEATYKKLKLIRSEGLSNIVLIDRQGFPTKYKNTQEVLEKYFKSMIEMFTDLKTLKLKKIKESIFDSEQRILFITKHNSGELIIEDQEDDVVYAKMDEFGIEHKYYDIIKARDFSQKKIEEHQKLIVDLKEEYINLFGITPEEMWIDKLEKLEIALKKLKICLTSKKSQDDRSIENVVEEQEKKRNVVIIKKTPKIKIGEDEDEDEEAIPNETKQNKSKIVVNKNIKISNKSKISTLPKIVKEEEVEQNKSKIVINKNIKIVNKPKIVKEEDEDEEEDEEENEEKEEETN